MALAGVDDPDRDPESFGTGGVRGRGRGDAGRCGSLHALPYGCHIGPTAYTVHSWDDAFL